MMRGGGMVTGLIVVLLGCVLILYHHKVSTPYMDEIFHVPQAQRYCDSDFTNYDPKITTPPGLYLISLFVTKTIGIIATLAPSKITDDISGEFTACSTTMLRGTNALVSLAVYPLLNLIREELYPFPSSNTNISQRLQVQRQHALHSLVIFLYPISAFFYCLYYTDSASLALYLVTYLMSIKYVEKHEDKTTYSSILINCLLLFASSLSIIVRQTNAVWILFIFG
jgi:alpha-1,2-glucosyltransferase